MFMLRVEGWGLGLVDMVKRDPGAAVIYLNKIS